MKCKDCRHEPNSESCIEAFDCDCEPSSCTPERPPLILEEHRQMRLFLDEVAAGLFGDMKRRRQLMSRLLELLEAVEL